MSSHHVAHGGQCHSFAKTLSARPTAAAAAAAVDWRNDRWLHYKDCPQQLTTSDVQNIKKSRHCLLLETSIVLLLKVGKQQVCFVQMPCRGAASAQRLPQLGWSHHTHSSDQHSWQCEAGSSHSRWQRGWQQQAGNAKPRHSNSNNRTPTKPAQFDTITGQNGFTSRQTSRNEHQARLMKQGHHLQPVQWIDK